MNDTIARLEQSLKDAVRLINAHREDQTDEAHVDDLLGHSVEPCLTAAANHVCCNVQRKHVLALDDQDVRKVVHYTSLKALTSMLEALANDQPGNAAFRLYDSAHLNDPDEGHYLFRSMPEQYRWIIKSRMRPAYIGSFITPDHDPVSDKPNRVNAWDNLVFWRAYGREGTGCSLLFKMPRDIRILGLRYGTRARREAMTQLKPLFALLNRQVEDVEKHSAKLAFQRRLGRTISCSLESVRYLYKSRAYAYENECRILRPADHVETTSIRLDCQTPHGRPAYLRHYCEADQLTVAELFKSSSVITIGPRVPEGESVRSCFRALLGNTEGPRVNLSQISYQAF